MKRKDDDLLRLAFGELTDDAARDVEAGADAAGRAEIEAFRSLRQGLQHLPPPPPDGLSAERLRAAILDRELRARPKPFAWGTALFVPVALTALAAVVLLPRLRPQAEPTVVADFSRAEREMMTPAFKLFGHVHDFSNSGAAAPVASPTKQAQVQSREVEPRVARRRSRRAASPPVAVPEPRENQLMTMVVPPPVDEDFAPQPSFSLAQREQRSRKEADREPMTIAAPVSTVVERTPGKGGDTETVVIVSNKRDIETGAPAATEKEVSSVLVGG